MFKLTFFVNYDFLALIYRTHERFLESLFVQIDFLLSLHFYNNYASMLVKHVLIPNNLSPMFEYPIFSI